MPSNQNGDLLVSGNLKNSVNNSYYFGTKYAGEVLHLELNSNNETQDSITIEVPVDESGFVNVDRGDINRYISRGIYGDADISNFDNFQIYNGDSHIETLLTTPKIILEESFENLRSSRGRGLYEGSVEGDNATIWNTNNNIEAQRDIISNSSDGRVHVELDSNQNTTMTTTLDLTNSNSYILTFDINPRDGGSSRNFKDTSDMKVLFGDRAVSIDSDVDGNLVANTESDNLSISLDTQDNGWTKVTILYDNVNQDSVDLSFSGTGNSDGIGMLLDNIKVVDTPTPIPTPFIDITETQNNSDIQEDTTQEQDVINAQNNSDTQEQNEIQIGEIEQGRDSDNYIGTVTYDNDENCELDNGREVDLYLATNEQDRIDGGDGNDKILFRDSTEGVTVNLSNNENEHGDADTDRYINFEGVTGSLHNDNITGDSGANTLQGGEGDDIVNGGAGSDWIVETTNNGSDTIDGGAGEHDTVAYYVNGDVNVNLETGENNQGDTLVNVENLSGQFGNDTLTGDAKDNVLKGNEGDDTLIGGAGNDILAGGIGNDTIDGGVGEDKIILKGYPNDYKFTQNDDGSVTVTDLRVGDANLDGIDTITNIELVEFQYKDDSCVNHFDIATIEDAIDGNINSNLGEITYSTDGFAKFANAVGFYKPDDDGKPELGKLLVDDQHTLEDGDHLAYVTPNDYCFFIIANGADEISKDSKITFDNSGELPILLVDGVAVTSPVYFSNPDLNAGGRDHFKLELDGNGGTTIKIEDLDLGDADFDDVVMHTNFEMTDFGYNPINAIDGSDNDDWINSTINNDSIDGGDGIDTVAYATNNNINANLESGIVTGHGEDTLSNIENIATGGGDDTIIGSSDNNRITTNGGDDTISGGDGNDIISGGAGNDTIDGGADIDKVILNGEATDFEFVLNDNNSVSVTDLRDGSVDTLTSIENVEFRYTDSDGKNHFDIESMASALINHAPEGESYEYVNDGIVSTPTNNDDNSNDNINESSYSNDTYGDDTYGDDTYGDEPDAKNDYFNATEDGKEFIESEDEFDDGISASGNVLNNDSGEGLELTGIEFNNNIIDIPSDGSNISIDSQYGTLTINKSGDFTFIVDDSSEAVDALNEGDSLIDTFKYTISDGEHSEVTANLNITIDGRDDAPVINSIEANNQAIHTINNVMDLDSNGMPDYISPEEFLDGDGANGIQFNENNGSVTINMGNANSSMSVDYHGGNAGYKNVLGFYEKDGNGNITDVKVLYSDGGDDDGSGGRYDSFLGEESINLGTLNNLNGEVGFFIIPNGNNGAIKNAIENGYEVSIDANNHIVFTNPNDVNDTVISNKAYYTDNSMSTDGRDHAIVTLNPNGGLTIGMEDLPENSSDQDYDDVVFSIKPCETLGSGNTILNNINISDIDNDTLEGATVTLLNMKDGDVISADELPEGINATITNGVVELNGNATLEDYTTALKSLTFNSNSEDRSVREFEFTLFDGDKHSNTMNVNVDIGGCQINTYEAPWEPQVLLEESFENLQTNRGWHVEHGEDGIVVGDHGVIWNTHDIGIEVQSQIVSKSSDGHTHAELDAHGNNSNVHMSTDVALTDLLNYTLTFDVKPRDGKAKRGYKDTSDMDISLDGRVVSIDSDKDGNLDISTDSPNTVVTHESIENGWTRITVEYTELDTDSAKLVINGTGAEDTYGMLLDNIKLVESNNQDIISNDTDVEPSTPQNTDTIILTDLGGDENGKEVTFKITGDHYDPKNIEDVGAGSPEYEIYINNKLFVDDNGVSRFKVNANRDYIENGELHKDGDQYELVTLRVDGDISTVGMKFVNDAWDGRNDNDGDGIIGEDRNLVIDEVTIGGTIDNNGTIDGGVTLQAEDTSTTTYLTNSGGDVSGRETMPWSGTMTFNVPSSLDNSYDDNLQDNNNSQDDNNSSTVIISENFENSSDGWDFATTNTDGNATNFLGRFGGSDGEEAVSKTYDFGVENAGKVVTIDFDMYEIDSWDDENFNLFINGEKVSSDTFSHFNRTWSHIATDEQDGGSELDNIGSSGKYYLDHDEAHHYTIEATIDENGELQLGFGSTLDQSLADESYGIDNITIKVGNDWDYSSLTTTNNIDLPIDDVNANNNQNGEMTDNFDTLLNNEERLFEGEDHDISSNNNNTNGLDIDTSVGLDHCGFDDAICGIDLPDMPEDEIPVVDVV